MSELVNRWFACVTIGAVTPVILDRIGGPDHLRNAWAMALAVGIVYWGLVLAVIVVPRHFWRGGLDVRARVADTCLCLAVGLLLFPMPVLATLLVLTSHLDDVTARQYFILHLDIQTMLRFLFWFPIGAGVLAASSWLWRRTPAGLCWVGLSLGFWLVMMSAHCVDTLKEEGGGWAEAYSCFLQQRCAPSGRIQLTPHQDPDSPTGIYIPTDLEDAMVELDRLLPACFTKQFLADGPIRHHLNIGMWLRNGWWLWHGSRLSQYFNKLGIQHPDDMSGIILTSYYRRLRQQPLCVADQIELYQTYWRLIQDGWRPWEEIVLPEETL
jgi:hypothetical protein